VAQRLSSRSQLPQPVKAAGACSPFVDETTNELQAVPLALGDQLGERVERHAVQTIDKKVNASKQS
jgi:hypothetical protein